MTHAAIRRGLTALAGGALLLAVPLFASSAPLGDSPPVPPELQTSVSAHPSPLPAPGRGSLVLTVSVPPGYHIFAGKDLRIGFPSLPGVTFGTPVYPEGTPEEGGSVLRGTSTVTLPVTLGSLRVKRLEGSLTLHWQGCQDYGDKVCFLPAEDRVPFSLPVALSKAPPPSSSEGSARASGQEGAGPSGRSEPAQVQASPSKANAPVSNKAVLPAVAAQAHDAPAERPYQQRFTSIAQHNIPFALLLAFLFGILSSLTPCVYPVIPITVAYIGSRSEGRGRSHGFLLSLAFVLGLALVYATLGAISAKAGQTFGTLTQTPWVGVPIALLFFLLAFSMFNLFEFKTPAFLTNRIEQSKQREKGKGFAGAFAIGALSGLVASPCVGPLILAILVAVAATGSVLLGFLYLFSFALGMGLLFVVIGTFSGVIASLPKSGTWMDGVRIVFGVLILAAGFYFAGLYLTPLLFWLVAGLILGFLSGFLAFGGYRHFFTVPMRISGIVLACAALLAVARLLPASEFSADIPSPAGWSTNLESAQAQGRAEERPLLLDFRADWCVACVELERTTWPSPELRAALNEVIPVRLDMTASTRANQSLQQRYGILGLPTVILLAPDGRELGRFAGYKSPAEFLTWFDGLMAATPPSSNEGAAADAPYGHREVAR